MLIDMADGLGQHIWDLVTLQFVDPWWFYLLDALVITIALLFLVYLFPGLKTVAGLVIIGMGLWLWGYDWAEGAARKKAEAAAARAAQEQARNRQDQGSGGWFGKW